MIKAIIIDDEAHVRKDIKEKLQTFFKEEITIMANCESVAKGLIAIQEIKPDLLFLDIQLSDGTGFDLLTQSEYKKFEIIFVTAYDDKAVKAIKVGALDYILKPVDDEEFKTAVNKAIENSKSKEKHIEKLIEISNEYFQGVNRKRVILKTADTVYAVYEDDIIYCKSDGNYTTIYTQQLEKIIVSKPIKTIEEILTDNLFIRCHQSYIVNKKYVLRYSKEGVLIVHKDIKIPVSGRRKDYVLKNVFT